MATNLETLMTQRTAAGPYQKSVRVLVTGVHPPIEYQQDGQTKMVVNCIVADGTRAVRVAVFDQTKFPRFVEGSGVILRNFIIKPETCSLTITSKSQVFPSAPVAVEASIMEEARRLFSPPPAEVTTIEKALASPVKTKVSIRGQIVREEAVQQVNYRSQKVDVKNIYIKDESQPNGCRVALWREATQTSCRPGDYVEITNVVINTYRNEVSLQTTTQSTVQQTEPPVEEHELVVASAFVEGEIISLLSGNDEVTELPISLFETKVPQIDLLEEYIIGRCNPSFTLKMVKRGSHTMSVDFTE